MTLLTTDDGIQLSYTEAGNPTGRPVVLLAGFKAATTSWCFQVPALVEAGYRVISVDLRGHGLADRDEASTMDRRGDDVAAVLTQLDLSDAVLVGGSMGGNTCWAYLARHDADRLAGVVVVDQTPKMLNTADWTHGYYGFTESNRDSYFATGIPTTGKGTPIWRRGRRLLRLIRAMRGGDRTLSPGELALLNDHAQRDWREVIANCQVPTLFVAGADSELWPSSHAAAAAELNPLASSVVIPHDGHAANIEQPKHFNQAVLDFLGGLKPRETA